MLHDQVLLTCNINSNTSCTVIPFNSFFIFFNHANIKESNKNVKYLFKSNLKDRVKTVKKKFIFKESN